MVIIKANKPVIQTLALNCEGFSMSMIKRQKSKRKEPNTSNSLVKDTKQAKTNPIA